MKKLFFIKSTTPLNYAYAGNQVYELEDEALAEKFISKGYAVLCPQKFTPLPVDLPARLEFISVGLISMEQLESLPKEHSLASESNGYGIYFPKTSEILADYKNQAKNKPKQNITY